MVVARCREVSDLCGRHKTPRLDARGLSFFASFPCVSPGPRRTGPGNSTVGMRPGRRLEAAGHECKGWLRPVGWRRDRSPSRRAEQQRALRCHHAGATLLAAAPLWPPASSTRSVVTLPSGIAPVRRVLSARSPQPFTSTHAALPSVRWHSSKSADGPHNSVLVTLYRPGARVDQAFSARAGAPAPPAAAPARTASASAPGTPPRSPGTAPSSAHTRRPRCVRPMPVRPGRWPRPASCP